MIRTENAESVLTIQADDLIGLIRAVHEKDAAFRFQVGGFSMRPAIRDGDVITLSPLVGRRPRRGEVAAFHDPLSQRLVVHRIVKCGEGRILARGDASPQSDGWIDLVHVLGLVTRIERRGKRVFWPDPVQNPAGAALFFRGYPLVAGMLRLARRLKRRLRRLSMPGR